MSDIFDYWKDKAITEDGEVVIDFGYNDCDEENLDVSRSIGVITDWGEPSCFCCERSPQELYKREDYDDLLHDNQVGKMWNVKEVTSTFDKAHIIPKALGGPDSPENLFILCHDCHRRSPDTRFKKQFFKWIYNERKHPHRQRIVEEACKELSTYGIPPLFSSDDLCIENLNTHGGQIVDATLVATLVGVAEERWNAINAISK